MTSPLYTREVFRWFFPYVPLYYVLTSLIKYSVQKWAKRESKYRVWNYFFTFGANCIRPVHNDITSSSQWVVHSSFYTVTGLAGEETDVTMMSPIIEKTKTLLTNTWPNNDTKLSGVWFSTHVRLSDDLLLITDKYVAKKASSLTHRTNWSHFL